MSDFNKHLSNTTKNIIINLAREDNLQARLKGANTEHYPKVCHYRVLHCTKEQHEFPLCAIYCVIEGQRTSCQLTPVTMLS